MGLIQAAPSMIIGGRSVSSGETFRVINPATEELVAECPSCDTEHVDLAVRAARAAFPEWASRPDADREEALEKLASLLKEHHDELAALITAEQGKPVTGINGSFEVRSSIAWTRATRKLALKPEVLVDNERDRIELHRMPVGVVGSITPWNWPLMIGIWHVVPALRIGCTVVIKPSSLAPLTTVRMVQLINEAGILPPGVLNVVTGSGKIGAHLAAHPGVDKIAFTGSTETGRKIMQAASGNLKRLTLELGGNDAGIVLPGTGITDRIADLFWSAFMNAGQVCIGLKRLYVHDDDYDTVCDAMTSYAAKVKVGDPTDPETQIGPLSNRLQYEVVARMVEDARSKGGRVLIGGDPKPGRGFFYPVTLVADATEEMELVAEEQFGTALPIIRYSDLDSAVHSANAVAVGLGASVWGDDEDMCRKVALHLEAGTRWVNRHAHLLPDVPMGGVKQSGIGVEFGLDGLREYTTTQVLNIALRGNHQRRTQRN